MTDTAKPHTDYPPLFDADVIEKKINRANNRITACRKEIEQVSFSIEHAFREGAPSPFLVAERARFIDFLLVSAWHYNLPDTDSCQQQVSAVSLIAVGGYGRGELHPGSDIDIMILLPEEPLEAAVENGLSAFITFLWDIGLEVGQSVRSLSQCMLEAEKDITVATNLMEARLLCGSETDFNELEEKTSPAHIWPSRLFFEAKWKEQIERHAKYHDTAYNLEPNIKESPGGLRDIQMIGWVTKRHFGDRTLHDLVRRNFLTEGEYHTLIEGQNFLWKIRFALHTMTGRREDRLLFDYQRGLATLFGYSDEDPAQQDAPVQHRRTADDPRLGVELFMREYYRTVMELRRLNEMLLQLYQEAILYPEDTQDAIKPINRRFQSCKGFIEVRHDQIFAQYPFALLEIYLLIQENPELKGIRASTIRLIRKSAAQIDETFREDLRCKTLFMEIFRQPSGLTHVLRRMNRHGVLAAYLPAFGQIVGLMQYDLFHVYTVDQHTLFVVRNLRRFTVAEFRHEFPLCSRIIMQIPKQELLYLAGLFHDIAKGRGGDHSVLGAEEVRAFCQLHELSSHDTDLVSWLIRNHLLMSATAQHKDIGDPDVIHEFAAQIQDRRRLDYLYLLTVADMRATNPKLWNSWKDALLIELYNQTRRALDRGLENPLDKRERIHDTQLAALRALGQQFSRKNVKAFFSHMPDDYFLKHQVEDIVWHAQCFLGSPADEHRVFIRYNDHGGRTELLAITPVRKSLFSGLTSTLDRLSLNIVEARLVTDTNNIAVDTFGVLEHDGKQITDPHRQQEIVDHIRSCLASNKAPSIPPALEANRRVEHFSEPTTVDFIQDENHQRTIMEVVSTDRQGLLSRIAWALLQADAEVTAAKITTLGALADDIFFLQNADGKPLTDQKQLRAIRQNIIELLEPAGDDDNKPQEYTL